MDHHRTSRPQTDDGGDDVDSDLTISYDQASDTLYIDRVQPYEEQESDDIGNSVIARFNPDTDEIETLEITFFSTRFRDGRTLRLPLTAAFRLSEPSPPVEPSERLPAPER